MNSYSHLSRQGTFFYLLRTRISTLLVLYEQLKAWMNLYIFFVTVHTTGSAEKNFINIGLKWKYAATN